MNIEFKQYLSKYKKLVAILTATAVISFIAVFESNIAPPIHNQKAVFFLSVMIETLAIITVFKNNLLKGKWESFALAFFLILYFSAHTLLTFPIPTSQAGEHDVKGFICLSQTLLIYKDNCPLLSLNELREASFEPHKLWVDWTISASKIILMILWCSFIWFSAKFIAMFALSKKVKL